MTANAHAVVKWHAAEIADAPLHRMLPPIEGQRGGKGSRYDTAPSLKCDSCGKTIEHAHLFLLERRPGPWALGPWAFAPGIYVHGCAHVLIDGKPGDDGRGA